MSHINLNLPAVIAGEQAFLDALASDLGNSDSRIAYADWLDENGDSARANFLRKFDSAFVSMKAGDLPDFNTVSNEWAQAIGARLVEGIINHELCEHRDDLIQLAQPTLVYVDPRFETSEDLEEAELLALYEVPTSLDDLKIDTSIPIGGSKFYGRPDLPAGAEWPRQKDCNSFYDEGAGIDPETPCAFVCQINFAELQSTQFGKMCPTEGLLSFFTCSEIEEIGMVDGYVVFTPNIDGLERLTPPSQVLGKDADEANTLFDAVQFEATEVWGIPCPGDASPFPVTARNYGDPQYESLGELAETIESNPLCSIGGYTQSTSSDDPLPGSEWIKLICVRNTIQIQLHFCIKKADLRAGKFDNVSLSWVDFD